MPLSNLATAEIEWNGFGSLYYGQTQNGDLTPYGFQDSRADFGSFSLFGLNVAGRISEKITIAAQLLAAPTSTVDGRGTNGLSEWNLTAKWAYGTYSVNDDVSIKLGRQLLPNFIGSEFESVAYLLPYRRIPTTMVITNGRALGFNGISAEYKFPPLGTGRFLISVFGGREDFANTSLWGDGYSVSDADLIGAVLTYDVDGFQARVQVDRSTPSIVLGTNTWQSPLDEITAGLRYDKYNFVTWAEWLYIRSTTGRSLTPGNAPFGDNTRSGYVMFGYRIGDWMPRYTFSTGISTFDSTKEAQVHSFGVNYQLATQAILKVDCEYQKFPNSLEPLGVATGETGDHATAVYAGVDFIF